MVKKNRNNHLQAPKVDRHEARCTICAHPQRQEIDKAFISWAKPANIVKEYKLGSRFALYRHAEATGLMERRRRNPRAALERIIERVDDVKPTGAAVIQAVALLAKINARGELVERGELAGLHELFSKMTKEEMEAYAESGELPAWFPGPAPPKDPEGGSGANGNE